MTRSPLAAWRKLFAIGGAPAASHATLSRAPSADRLLDPLAGARIAHATSLDALARPIDVGSLLSRVANAAYGTESPAAEVPGTDVVRGGKRARAVEVARQFESTNASTIAVPSALPRKRPPSHAAIETKPARTGGSAGPMRPAEKQILRRFAPRMTMSGASLSTSQHRFAINESVDDGVARVMSPPSSAVIESTSRSGLPSNISLGARAGGDARVVLSAAVAGVDRLLAIGAPTPLVPAKARTPAPANSGANPSPSPTRDVARLLADVVDRAGATSAAIAAGAAVTAAVQESPRSVGSRRRFDAPPAELQPSTHASASPSDVEHTGGFRGLARRTLTPTQDPPHVLAQRIEPETRIASDLTLDTLDDRVADSLARVLEREARRHGIDLAEARS